MSQANVETARRWFEEVWNRRDVEVIGALSAPGSVGHLASGDVGSIDEFKRLHAEFLSALPDLHITIEDTVADGDNVVVRWVVTGSHGGEGFGCPPTGCQISERGMTWMRFRDGQIQEAWDAWNLGALFAQLRGVTV